MMKNSNRRKMAVFTMDLENFTDTGCIMDSDLKIDQDMLDGLDEYVSILDKYNIKATFFLLGSWTDDYHTEVQKIYDAGHEIGNHGYSHKDMPTMNYEDILVDIQKCNETIRSITGHSPTLLRAPSGAYDNKTISAAENLGMTTIQWDVEPLAKVGNGYI